MIKREQYLKILREARDKKYVKLLTGVRRSGKSTLLNLFMEELATSGVDKENIVYINFEMMQNDYLRHGENLHKFIDFHVSGNNKFYLFLDEVQEIENWAKVVNSLRVTFNIDIYATGSNARMFIGEHLTYLAGRYIKIDVYPLSLDEIKMFYKKELSNPQVYNLFLDSSFPSVVLECSKELKKMLQHDIFDAIFTRDIILRGKVNNESIFFQVASFVLEHIGSNISINKIKNTLVSNGTNISFDAVLKYIDLMIKSYFLYECKRYDVRGKEVLKSNHKYYVIDMGIRNQIIPNKNSNSGRVLENVVYLELLKKGYRVYTGIVGREYEVDFVAIKDEETLYVQVSESIIDPKTREREERVFNYIDNKYRRYLVTLDEYKYESDQYNHLNLYEFIKVI
ncbi:MAG: ATP-binding protein [Acholeplasma sp.]|nr:ATP-binding protein [Acholeplasma sp.]